MSRQGSAEFRSLEDVLAYQLEDLYDAEVRILDGLPKMAEAASSLPLKDLLQTLKKLAGNCSDWKACSQ